LLRTSEVDAVKRTYRPASGKGNGRPVVELGFMLRALLSKHPFFALAFLISFRKQVATGSGLPKDCPINAEAERNWKKLSTLGLPKHTRSLRSI
jgi:hypothetical protein